jgi:hypothetical protein
VETVQRRTVTRAAIVARPAASPQLVQRRAAGPVASRIQPSSLRVSRPSDPAEKEAESVASRVVGTSVPESSVAYVRTPDGGGVFRRLDEAGPTRRKGWQSPYVARFAGSGLQRKMEGHPDVSSNVEAEIRAGAASGAPLPLGVRRFMEPRFRADFSKVRVHTGEKAAALSSEVNARAFAVGNQLYFGKDQFRPESREGKELIAHELTHTIQQGSAVQRSEAVAVTQTAPVQLQRGVVDEALDYFADKANILPGFRLFTIIIGVNPINGARVDPSGANILRAAVEIMPGGGLVTMALDNYGIFEKGGAFVEQQMKAFAGVGSALIAAVKAFARSLGPTDAFRLGTVWERAKAMFTDPIDRAMAAIKGLVKGLIQLVKDAILRPLADLASRTRAWDLVKALLGKDPITDEPYPPTPENLIGALLKLANQEEVWKRIQEGKAIAKVMAWFQKSKTELMGFVNQIPSLFMQALKSLGIADIIIPPLAFAKIVGVFGDFAGKFVTWGGNAALDLLEIVFDVVKPGAMGYIKKTGAALKGILKNPLPFVGNLVKAAKLGFTNFASHFLGHLKAGLIDWLTGSLPGVYIPKAFSLAELVKFVFSVLGISWANIRQKLVKVVGEPVMQGLEKVFDVVVTLVNEGPAAAWAKIKEQLNSLQDMVVGGITDLVVDAVVTKGIPKLIAMFIPGAGFVSAIISIYDTVMVFVNKISKIVAVVTAFVDSIVAIAGGAIGAAAGRVESILAGLVSLAINFLAGFAGLGKVADKIMGVIAKVRGMVDKAIDWLINFIVTTAKKLFAKLFGKKDKDKDKKEDDPKSAAVKAKVAAELAGKSVGNAEEEQALIASLYSRYSPEGLKTIRFQPSKSDLGAIDVVVSASAAEQVAKINMKKPEGLKELSQIGGTMAVFAGRTTIRVYYGADSRFFASVTQARGKPGHAELRLRGRFPDLLERIRRQQKTKLTPLAAPIPIRLDINRTPCDGCATSHLQSLLAEAASGYPDVPFALTISSASVSQGAQITTEAGIAALLAKGVTMTSSTVWTEIKKQMQANGIQQIDYGSKTYDMGDVNEFIANASEVQALIDKAVAGLNKGKPVAAAKP